MSSLSFSDWITVLQWLLGGAFASLVWLVRLEASVKNERATRAAQIEGLKEMNKAIREDHTAFQERIYDMLREIRDEMRRKADKP